MTTSDPKVATQPGSQSYKILVAVAFDRTAEPALKEGINLAAHRPGSELHVVHVTSEADPTGATHSLLPTAEGPEAASAVLRRHIEVVWQQTGELQVIAHIRSGKPAPAILQAAIDIAADVIVVGTHRRAGLKKLALGSVAEQVLHAAHCPVLIALAKDYAGEVASPSLAPPCQDCLQARAATANATFWCERHSRAYLQPHIYVPRDQGRNSVFQTY